jgi:hypothetical protein
MDKIKYELFLAEFNVFIEGFPDDNDVLLMDAILLKSRFIDLFGGV